MHPKLVLLTFLLCVISYSGQSLAQIKPACLSPTSDADGDGFGWENNQTCIVDKPLTLGTCEDRGDYPWGWNPVTLKSCLLNQSTTPTECIDTEPLNNGWGWNGLTSCRIPIEKDAYRCDDFGNAPWGWNPTLSSSCRLDLVSTPVPSKPLWMLPTISPSEILNTPMTCKRVRWWSQFENNPVFDMLEEEQDPSKIFFTATLRDLHSTSVTDGTPYRAISIEGSWMDTFNNQPASLQWNTSTNTVNYTLEQPSSPFPSGTLKFYRVENHIAIDGVETYFDISEFRTAYCVIR